MKWVVVTIVAIVAIVWMVGHRSRLFSTCFFDTETTYPELTRTLLTDEVWSELMASEEADLWVPWPEPLANRTRNWNTLPLYGFGHFTKETDRFPRLTQRLRQLLPTLQLATFSRLSPGTRLSPHCGWASHSNDVLRSHLLLRRPRRRGTCSLHVDNETHVYDQVGEWITFDDSKLHWAQNVDEEDDRIVLIVDMKRPPHIPRGQSTSPDSTELQEFVKTHQKS